MRTSSIIAAALVLGVVVPVLDPGRAIAATIKVAANGVDSASCGEGVQPPCISLAQAVANASAGDTIQVGPGRYGGPLIDKRLILVSTNGPAVTMISGPVTIAAAGTVLGRRAKGFTLLHASVEVLGDDVQITDNVAVQGVPGFALRGNRTTLTGNQLVRNNVGILVWDGTGHEVIDNVFSDNNAGFSIVAGTDMVVRGNTSIRNRTGFVIGGSGHVLQGNVSTGDDFGFAAGGDNVQLLQNVVLGASERGYDLASGTGWILTGNVAAGSRTQGFFLRGGGTYQLTGNVATGNSAGGVILAQGSGHVVTGNSFFGNSVGGFHVDATVGSGVVAQRNNLFGNAGCGITNASSSIVDARNSFWGAATGPGAYPANGACGVGAVTTAPFAPRAFLLKVPTLP
jgi:parallel beta-helix repeat protein